MEKGCFHCFVYACPSSRINDLQPTSDLHPFVVREPPTWLAHDLRVSPHELVEPFGRSFEEVFEELLRLPRMFVEGDGSFVWVVEGPGGRYQIDGNLHDSGGRVVDIELKGSIHAEALDQLLRTFGWPTQVFLFQLVPQGICIHEASFRALFVTDDEIGP